VKKPAIAGFLFKRFDFKRGAGLSAAFADPEGEYAFGFLCVQQGMASLAAKGVKVFFGARICGSDFQYLFSGQLIQGLFAAQDGQWAVQVAGIKIFIKLHELS